MPFADESFDSVGYVHHAAPRARPPALQDQILAEALRVLRPGGVLVGSDSLASNDLHHFHDGDTYNPVEPASLLSRLQTLGFGKITIRVDDVLTFVAHKPGRRRGVRVMNDAGARCAPTVIGLVSFAAAEEQMLLAAASRDGAQRGSPARWAAAPLVAHNAEFRHQQVQRLAAIRDSRIPPTSPRSITRRPPCTGATARSRPARSPTPASGRRSELVAGLAPVTDEDLLDPGRHPG